MPIRSLILIATLVTAVSSAWSQQQPLPTPSVAVTQPWARATAGNVRNGAAYLTLSAASGQPDRLLSASSPAAATVELHTVGRNASGVMEMRAVSAIEVAPAAPTVLAPGGLHIMLIGLRAPLKQGDSLPLTLTFERSGRIEVAVPVGPPGAMHPGH